MKMYLPLVLLIASSQLVHAQTTTTWDGFISTHTAEDLLILLIGKYIPARGMAPGHAPLGLLSHLLKKCGAPCADNTRAGHSQTLR